MGMAKSIRNGEILEAIKDVFEVNRDICFTYKDNEYFLTYSEDETGAIRRCFRIAPANEHENALQSKNIIWLDNPTIENVRIDGKTLPEIAESIRISSIY